MKFRVGMKVKFVRDNLGASERLALSRTVAETFSAGDSGVVAFPHPDPRVATAGWWYVEVDSKRESGKKLYVSVRSEHVVADSSQPTIPAEVSVDLSRREMRLFTEDQVKRAFWEHFHQRGEIFFDYLGSPEKSEASTAEEWGEFTEKLFAQPIVALQAVDYRALLVKLLGYVDVATAPLQWHYLEERARPEASSPWAFTDTEWAELQRLAGEAERG